MKDGTPCHFCTGGKYREVRATGASPLSPAVSQFSIGSRVIRARVLICDSCLHIEFYNVPKEVENPNS